MEEDNVYKKIQEAISSLPQNFSVLEEQIDIELQMEYFNYGRDLKTNFPPELILQHKFLLIFLIEDSSVLKNTS